MSTNVKHTPVRIWATVNGQRSVFPGASYYLIGGWEDRPSERGTEYVRADVVDDLLNALKAAMAFIDSHVADPDITAKMASNFSALQSLDPHALIAKATGGA